MDIGELIAQKTGQLEERKKSLKEVIKETDSLEKSKNSNLKKKFILQQASEKARKIAYDTFARISTKGINGIFGDNVEVKILSSMNNQKPTADFIVETDNNGYKVDTDPGDEDGGGLADIVSLAAFFSMNVLSGDKNSSPLFLDEPTKFVSDELHTDAAIFIKKMSEAYGKQVIMVTHAQKTKYVADNIIEVKLSEDGVSQVTQSKA